MDEIEFSDLSKRVLNIFISSSSISEFLTKISAVLEDPVIIVDGAYKLLASSPIKDFHDYQWEKAIANGYYSDEFIAEIVKSFRKNDRLIFTKEPFDRSHSLSKYSRTICKLIMDGTTLGSLVVLNVNPLSPERRSLLPLISKLSLRFPLAVKEQMGAGDERFYAGIFLDLILGEIKTNEMLSSRLIPSGIDLPEKFQLLTIFVKSYTRIAVGTLKNNFERMFPGCWTIYYNNHFHVLRFGHSDMLPLEHYLAEIISILEKYFLVLCCGEYFDNILLLQNYYNFNISALKLAEKVHCAKTVIFYNDYRFLDIVIHASHNMKTVLDNLVSRKIIEIREWDRINGTNYFETLYTFLTSEKNYAVTAEKLWTHRNTIVYRIKKIKEHFGINLDSFDEYFSILYSCVIMHEKDLIDIDKSKNLVLTEDCI